MKIVRGNVHIVAALLLATSAITYSQLSRWWQDGVGVVKSETMAKDLAKIYFTSVFGKEKVESELPLQVRDAKTDWQVSGTLPKNTVGGVMVISIKKKDGSVTYISHGK